MIFIGSNNYPKIMKFCVYALHAKINLHKNFGPVLMKIICSLNLDAFYRLINIQKMMFLNH